ncbi:MAG: hypothetical protein ACQESK_11175 [Bacteroidota bacterium]
MKLLFSLLSLIFLISCNSTSTVVYHPELKKRVKVFENDDFKVYYPKSWVTFNSKIENNPKDSLFRISPKKQIFEGFVYVDTINGEPRRIKKAKNDENYNALKDKIIHPNITNTYVEIYTFIERNTNIETVIQQIETDAQQVGNIDMEVIKISDSFYIVKLRHQATTRSTNFSFGSFVYKSYIKRNESGDVYQFIFKANEYYFSDYEEEANLVLRSFELKNKAQPVAAE